MTREWILLKEIYDAFAKVNFKNASPYPTPWLAENSKRIGGGKKKLSNADVLQRLHAMNPEEKNG